MKSPLLYGIALLVFIGAAGGLHLSGNDKLQSFGNVKPSIATASEVWTRALQSETGNKDEIDGVATDAEGNTFIGGLFSNQVELVGPAGNELTFTAGTGSDVFLAKLDQQGNVLWEKTFDSGANDYMWDLTTDQNGDLLISGGYSGELTVLGNLYSARDNGSAYYAKLDGQTGDFLWFRAFGALNPPATETIDAASLAGGNEIKVDHNDNVIVTLSAAADAYQIDGQTYPRLGYMDSFIIKLSPAGEVIWVHQFKGAGQKQLRALGITGQNEIAFGHQVIGPMLGVGGETVVDNREVAQGVAGLLSADGDLKWMIPVTSEGFTNVRGAGGAPDGGAYFTGQLVGTGQIGDEPLLAPDEGATFLAKYSSEGVAEWTRLLGNEKTGGAAGELVARDNLVAITSANVGARDALYDGDGKTLMRDVHNIKSSMPYALLTVFDATGTVVATHAPTKSDFSLVGVLEFAGPECLVWQHAFWGQLEYANGDSYLAPDTRDQGYLNKDSAVVKVCW